MDEVEVLTLEEFIVEGGIVAYLDGEFVLQSGKTDQVVAVGTTLTEAVNKLTYGR